MTSDRTFSAIVVAERCLGWRKKEEKREAKAVAAWPGMVVRKSGAVVESGKWRTGVRVRWRVVSNTGLRE